jgi:hypothetical protein
LPTGSCAYSVTNTGGSNRTITTYSNVTTSVSRMQVTLTIGATNITINTWQEVP